MFFQVPESELVSTGSASAVLQRMHGSIALLRQMVRTVATEVRLWHTRVFLVERSEDADIVDSLKSNAVIVINCPTNDQLTWISVA